MEGMCVVIHLRQSKGLATANSFVCLYPTIFCFNWRNPRNSFAQKISILDKWHFSGSFMSNLPNILYLKFSDLLSFEK